MGRSLRLVVLVAFLAAVLPHTTLADADLSEEEEAAAAGCNRGFTREIRRVCGSDGTIYLNPSMFTYHQCMKQHKGEQLTQQHMSFCDPAFDDTQDL